MMNVRLATNRRTKQMVLVISIPDSIIELLDNQKILHPNKNPAVVINSKYQAGMPKNLIVMVTRETDPDEIQCVLDQGKRMFEERKKKD